MRLKIPKISDEVVISAFSDGVSDLKMEEEFAMSDEMSTALEMFNLANKCARAEEGRVSLLGPQAAEPKEKKTKAKEMNDQLQKMDLDTESAEFPDKCQLIDARLKELREAARKH